MVFRSRPDISHAEAAAAIDAILERRVRRLGRDDPAIARFSDEPLDVCEYIVNETRGMPDDVIAADVVDALRILERVRRTTLSRLDGLEHRLLLLGVQAGLTYRQLSDPLGLKSRQAVQQRLGRLHAHKQGLPRTDRAARMGRWVETGGAELRRLLREVAGRWDQVSFEPDQIFFTADDIDDLEDALLAADDVTRDDHWRQLGFLSAHARLMIRFGAPSPSLARTWSRLEELLHEYRAFQAKQGT